MSDDNLGRYVEHLREQGLPELAAQAEAMLGAPAAPQIPGEVAPAGLPVQVQEKAAELAASGIVPGGEVTREQLKRMTAHEIAALPQDVVNAAMAGS